MEQREQPGTGKVTLVKGFSDRPGGSAKEKRYQDQIIVQ